MTNSDIGNLKALLAQQLELTKVMIQSLSRISAGVSGVCEGLGRVDRALCALEERQEEEAVLRRLVQRGTVTREQAEGAQEGFVA